MANRLAHRGPDDSGRWVAAEQGVGLAHRRLAIVDLSPGGHQPMHSADGRYCIVFNGEIYNHGELRRDLEAAGTRFRSSSDTETLVEALARWGIVAACKMLVGMFAFAVWDKRDSRLWLARDRLGKKPLYVYRDANGDIAFASELKSLWAFPGFSPTLSAEAISEYFSYSYIADHQCVFREVIKVLPGSVVAIDPGKPPEAQSYWSFKAVVESGANARIESSDHAQSMLLDTLRDATRKRMIADVPLGAFLSGGIDSGLVVSLMQEASSRKVRTFSIGFRDQGYDEAPIAASVARHLGTDHTELYVTDAEAQAIVPSLADVFDEPFADASQIPTCLLSKLTRRFVTVAMTGDGGDESFGGYLRYRNQYGAVGRLCSLPRPIRSAVSSGLMRLPAGLLEALVQVVPANRRPRFIASKVAKVARAMKIDDAAARGKAYLAFWSPHEVLSPAFSVEARDPFVYDGVANLDSAEQMQFWESQHYLSGDLLTKADRATMAYSLEARCPLLDHRVVELAWRLNSSMKASPQGTKWILRKLLFQFVPRELVDLPKQGFSVPIGAWMSTGLRDWTEDMLTYGRARLGDIIHWPTVDAAWTAHRNGQLGYVEKLWIVAMFCAWHSRWLGQTATDAQNV
jgi:asparagine synthase (glutamine-hydrolysing)